MSEPSSPEGPGFDAAAAHPDAAQCIGQEAARLGCTFQGMGTAGKIRFLRVRAGKSAQEIAAGLGLNESWYRDLESYDDELASTLTMFQAQQLAWLLGVRLADLVEETAPTGGEIALLDLPSMVEAHLARESMSIADFEERIGWELQAFLESPVRVAAEVPVMFVQDLSAALGINWQSLLPEPDAP